MGFKDFFRKNPQSVAQEQEGTKGGEREDSAPKEMLSEPGKTEADKINTIRLAREVLNAKDNVALAKSSDEPLAQERADRALAKALLEQARFNVQIGTGSQEGVKQAMRHLKQTEDAFRTSETGEINLARTKAAAHAEGRIDVGGYTAEQIEVQNKRIREYTEQLGSEQT